MNNQNDCQSRREAIAALVLDELELQAADELAKHIDVCETCRLLYQALTDEEERIRSAFGAISDRSQTIQHNLVDQFGRQAATAPDRGTGRRKTRDTKIIWRTIMKSKITKLAAAAVIIVAVCVVNWSVRQQGSSNTVPFSLLAQACAAEDAIFAGEQMVFIENEIIVYPVTRRVFSAEPAGGDLGQQVKKDFEQLESGFEHTWLPMCSLGADGQFRFNQLKLSTDVTQPYTVTDRAWYDPPTARFVRVLEIGEEVVFANSYDGEVIYTSHTTSDGSLQITKEPVGNNFRPPQKPAEFLGISAGLRSTLHEKDLPMLQDVSEGTLQDGCPVLIYKVGTPDPNGKLDSYFLFKVRRDDGTIAEKEFVIFGESQLLIRRVLTESVQAPAISWNLAEIEERYVAAPEEPLVSITPDMVLPNVSVKHMIERSKFETYIFVKNPSWAGHREIIDCIDPASPGYRMFCIAYRADDGRHVVMVQSQTYNKMLGNFAKQGQLVYTSPNGFKVWGGGPDKWYSNILLSSARASIKDPPAEDRIGYVLESPAGTFPALAVNGPLTVEELHSLIDSLVPAKEYREE
ncbi:MAG: anti-sigma factor family protein [Planctomycetota bacterium]|jgi:hypothetical protein